MGDDQTKILANGGDPNILNQILALVQKIDAELQEVKTRQDALEEKIDRRLIETRPIWEAVLEQVKKMREEMEAGFRLMNHKFSAVGEDVLELRAHQRDFEIRLNKIEAKLEQPQ